MLRLFMVFFLLLFAATSFADKTEEQLRTFLQSREVVSQIYFEVSSVSLSPRVRETLDQLVPALKSRAKDNILFRVEGFSSAEGQSQDNVSLSMNRALAVRNYLIENHELNLEIFLTGFGASGSIVSKEESRRVDIAMYRQSSAVMALFDDQGTVEKILIK